MGAVDEAISSNYRKAWPSLLLIMELSHKIFGTFVQRIFAGSPFLGKMLSIMPSLTRVGIHEHNITKRLKSFRLCFSQLLLLADFSPLYDFLRLEFSTATAGGRRGGFGIMFVYQNFYFNFYCLCLSILCLFFLMSKKLFCIYPVFQYRVELV
jgi:hypothetical protein